MVLNKEVFKYIDGDDTTFERTSVNRLVEERQLMGYFHSGFWQCMDTQREKKEAGRIVGIGRCPLEKVVE